MTRLRLLPVLLLIAVFAGGCTTATGNYFGNRARDFGECFRLEAGVGPNIGASVNALGLLHTGLELKSEVFSFGWVYGDVVPGGALGGHLGRAAFHFGVHHSNNRYHHECIGVVPALFSLERLHGPVPPGASSFALRAEMRRWSRVHAFDLEVSASLGINITAGFSPVEFLDFLLGWFLLDIAGDDR